MLLPRPAVLAAVIIGKFGLFMARSGAGYAAGERGGSRSEAVGSARALRSAATMQRSGSVERAEEVVVAAVVRRGRR